MPDEECAKEFEEGEISLVIYFWALELAYISRTLFQNVFYTFSGLSVPEYLLLKSYPKEENELISTRHSEQEITAVAFEHCDSIEGEHLLMAQGYNDGSIGKYFF